MGKQKRDNKKYSIDLFVKVFNHLIDVHRSREKFALSWIWNDEKAFKLFLEMVLGIHNGSRDMLRNGYHHCRSDQFETFPPVTWGNIDEIFLNKRLQSDLPAPVRKLLQQFKSLSKLELSKLLEENEGRIVGSSTYSQTWKQVTKISPTVLEKMQGCFLGEWTVPAKNIFKPELAKVCRPFPPECVFAESTGNLTYFYERNGNDVKLIAVHLKKALEFPAMRYLRTLLEELFKGHPKLLRQSMASLDSHMTGFGPFWQRFETNGGTKVSFYTQVEKLGKVLKSLPPAKDFEMLVDRYAHTHLSAIILALYMWKLPMLVHSFLKFSKPFLDGEDYEASNLEVALGGCGPCAYQMYITKDFCSKIHKDADLSKFTLSYCGHPDADSTTPVPFVMAGHGFIIPIENGSMFAFDSAVAHGTAYRNRSRNAVYMGCVVVNSALHALTKRRQLL